MAYTTPPTFVAGAILTASQLNTLSGDIEFLHGVASGLNVPFSSVRVTGDSINDTKVHWYIRHKHRYLHYRARVTAGDIDEFRIYYNGTRIVQDDTNRSSPYTYQSTGAPTATYPATSGVVIDLNGLSLTVGNWYEIYVEMTQLTTMTASVDYILESDATSI